MTVAPAESLLEDTILFCRALREEGVPVTPAETLAAVSTLSLIDVEDRDETFLSLRSVLSSSVEDFPVFERLFEQFWAGLDRDTTRRTSVEPDRSLRSAEQIEAGNRRSTESSRKGLAYFLQNWAVAEKDSEQVETRSASNISSDAQKDLTVFAADDLVEITRLAKR